MNKDFNKETSINVEMKTFKDLLALSLVIPNFQRSYMWKEINLKKLINDLEEFLLSNKDVAKGYGVSIDTIRSHLSKNRDEFIEGKHFTVDKSYKNTRKIFWTKKGIVRLGFFIKSEEAKKFRDWAEDYIVNEKSSNSDLKALEIVLKELEKQNQEIQNLKNQLASKEPQKPKNPFAGYYENRNRDLGQRENEFAYTRNDWMMLLNECENQLALERTGKGKTLLLSRGAK